MGDKCHWAHGPGDLDVRAFNFDFPLAAGEHKQGDWEHIEGRRPSSVRTGKQKGRQADGTAAFSSRYLHSAVPSANMPALPHLSLESFPLFQSLLVCYLRPKAY